MFVGQLVPFADRALHIPPSGTRLGLLYAGWGVGGVVGTLLYPRLVRRYGEVRMLLGTAATVLPLGFGVALARQWPVAAITIAVWGVPHTLAMVNAVTLRAKVTPDRLQSRVNTTGRMLSFGGGTPIGAVVGGLVTQGYGVRSAFLAMAAVQGLPAVVAWASPLRRLRGDPRLVTVAR
jgi:predicted MFS family arabinose efflux permease